MLVVALVSYELQTSHGRHVRINGGWKFKSTESGKISKMMWCWHEFHENPTRTEKSTKNLVTPWGRQSFFRSW